MSDIQYAVAVSCDLDKPLARTQLTSPLVQADDQAHVITVTVTRDGEPVIPSAATAAMIRANETTLVLTPVVYNNTVVLTLPEAAYAIPGRAQIVIRATAGGVVSTVGWVDAVVLRSVTDTYVDPGTVVPDITELLAQIAACEAAATSASTAAAAATSAAANVMVGREHYNGETADRYYFSNSSGYCRGLAASATARMLRLRCLPNTTYVFSCGAIASSKKIGTSDVRFVDKTTANVFAEQTEATADPLTITSGANDTHLAAQLFVNTDASTDPADYYASISITEYVPQSRVIEDSLAQVEDYGTASVNYAEGDLLITGNTLYKATEAIASGEAIVPGTGGNVVETTIAAELNALRELITT